MTETAFTFDIQSEQVIGICHTPDGQTHKTGLLIVVGGPQYRIGAHRQYVHMARFCADQGIACMRFDYRGVGDGHGTYSGFEQVSPDIHAAIDEFRRQCPDIEQVAIWGLCEGASAILLGGAEHQDVSDIILVNPWVRSEAGLAKAYVKHYYLDKLKDPAFWKKLFGGGLNIKQAFAGLWQNVTTAFGKPKDVEQTKASESDTRPFPERMLSGLQVFDGRVLLIQSENDLTAREFDDLVNSSSDWQKAFDQKDFSRIDIADTDHTFSSEKWRSDVANATAKWLLRQ